MLDDTSKRFPNPPRLAWEVYQNATRPPVEDHFLREIGPQCSRILYEQVRELFTGPLGDAILHITLPPTSPKPSRAVKKHVPFPVKERHWNED